MIFSNVDKVAKTFDDEGGIVLTPERHKKWDRKVLLIRLGVDEILVTSKEKVGGFNSFNRN